MKSSNGSAAVTAILVCCFTSVLRQAATSKESRAANLPPLIFEHPPREIVFRQGERFEVPCAAYGNPSYSWRKDEQDFNPSKIGRMDMQPGKGTLIFEQPVARDEAMYQCFARNKVGVAVSVKVYIRVAYLEKFQSTNVDNHRVIGGFPMTLRCNPPPSYPKPEISWVIISGVEEPIPIRPDERISIDPEGNLHFAYIEREDEQSGNRYACVASNSATRSMEHGDYAVLRIPYNVVQYAVPNATWTSSPQQVGLRGETWRVTCIFSGRPSPSVDWIRIGGSLPERARIENYGRELVIPSAEFEDTGTYECQGINDEVQVPITRSFDLIVEARPSWIKQPKSINAAKGDDVVFHCEAEAVPQPEYLWFLDGVPIQEWPGDPDLIMEKNNLTFINLTADESWVIQCNATNKHGYVFANAYLNIQKSITNEDKTAPLLVEGIIAAVALLVVIIPFLLIWCKTRTRQSSSRPQHDTEEAVILTHVSSEQPQHPDERHVESAAVPLLPAEEANEPNQMVPTTHNTGLVGKKMVATHPYEALHEEDIDLIKDEDYVVVDDSKPNWLKVTNKTGDIGYIPSNYVKEKSTDSLSDYDWYLGNITRTEVEEKLRKDKTDGCFMVFDSRSQDAIYVLALFTTETERGMVRHYRIFTNPDGKLYLSDKKSFDSLPDLVKHHQYNSDILARRLRAAPGHGQLPLPIVADLGLGQLRLDRANIELGKELGKGEFGVVQKGRYCGEIDVAVKMMKEGAINEDAFIEEAGTLKRFQHENVVRLYGIVSEPKPMWIVLEYLEHGDLLRYLNENKGELLTEPETLLKICSQICNAMKFLESQQCIHRDLAARNCLVGENNVVKVGDFGLARYVMDNEYISAAGAKRPVRILSPEALKDSKYSSKSDVWAYGITMWEIWTGGEKPYGRMKNTEVAEKVCRQGYTLERPEQCDDRLYEIMKNCWKTEPEERPSFAELYQILVDY